ncbi:hypothetical protein F5Y12DRAFT_715201 [Xylaria sp. FL1777]|nr:hypothetical protein F5Y12DRAFT_715201 [Xylaria sp. FL1777]
MHSSMIFSFFLAALVAAAPSPNGQGNNVDAYKRELVTFVMTEPDCAAIKDYCTHCNGFVSTPLLIPPSIPTNPREGTDFNCETDPRCEWCYTNKQFGN